MPANLTPQYFKEEERFRAATTPEEKIKALRAMYAVMPKHKGTDKLQADIKRRIARLKDATRQKHTDARQSPAWVIEKEGAGQVPVLGPPNCGKSALIAALTNARPRVTEYPYATQTPLPAMMPFEDIQFQLIDTPSLGEAYTVDWIPDLLRRADACLMLADLSTEDVVDTVQFILGHLEAKGVYVAERRGQEKDELEGWIPAMLFGNKMDVASANERLQELTHRFGSRFQILGGSVKEVTNLDAMKRTLFETAAIIRVYSKEPGKTPDTEQPFVLPSGSTVIDMASKVHKEVREKLQFARIWGSGRFDGQRVSDDHLLEDGDILELHSSAILK